MRLRVWTDLGLKPLSFKTLLLGLAALVAAVVALDLAQSAQAQSDEQSGRIVAQRLADGRTEFGWQPTGGARVLPSSRYFPADAEVGRWLNSSQVEVEGEWIGRINARLLDDGRIEFAFTPTDRERILTDARYFPAEPRPNRWLRSTKITIEPMLRYVAISAGYDHTCAIREDGAIQCWGADRGNDSSYQHRRPPEGSFIAVSARAYHSCAIAETFETAVSNASAAAGEIECWGDLGGQGWTDAPSGNFTAVAAGRWHNCAIRAESGAIECWGDTRTDHGQLESPPTGRFSAVSAGQIHTCAISTAGAIQCWGNNERGQTDAPAGSFTAVSASGGMHNCALRADGAILCWGADPERHTPPAGSFTAVATGAGHNCAIRTSGAIVCWGSDSDGETQAPAGRFSAVAAGRGHNCAIRESGAIQCWGSNEHGQTDVPTP